VKRAGRAHSNAASHRGQEFPDRLQEVLRSRGYRDDRTLLVETDHIRGDVLHLAAHEGSVHATAGEGHASLTTTSTTFEVW
jgi:hypothetical protein